MFGLTKREQRWKAEQQAAELLVGLAQTALRAQADVHIAEELNEGKKKDKRIAELEAEIAATEKQVEILTDTLAESREQNKQLLDALKEIANHYDTEVVLSRDIASAAIAAVEGKQ